MQPHLIEKHQKLYDDFLASGLSATQYFKERKPPVCQTYFYQLVRLFKDQEEQDSLVRVVHLEEETRYQPITVAKPSSRRIKLNLGEKVSLEFECADPETFLLRALEQTLSGVRL